MRISPHHLFTTEITFAIILFLLKDTVIAQQEGASVINSGTNGKPYNCDPNTCQIANNCLCASKNPPNNLSPQDAP